MRFSVLSSGSKANCTFLEADGLRFLIDAGLSCRQIEMRLGAFGIAAETVDAIFVTHEHSDHIRGVPSFSRKYEIPVYSNAAVLPFLEKCHGNEIFETGRTFELGDVTVHPFSIVHDAAEPVGFAFGAEGLKFAQATDLGRVTPLVREALRMAHALVIESNHDPMMLQECGYPWELKQRISSAHGHLSNFTAGNLLDELMHVDLRHVVLGHLSENSNRPELALATVRGCISRHEELMRMNGMSLLCGEIARATPLACVGEVAQPAAAIA